MYGIFRTAGYPEAVAHTLTGLCTNVVPVEEPVAGTPARPPAGHTAPAAGRADLARARQPRRLDSTATVALAARSAPRTRATPTTSCSPPITTCARLRVDRDIARDEGFRVNAAKTRVMGRGSRQTVTGIVVNVRPNVPRAEYDRLKAILHRAALDGPGDLDPAHVMGRIAWVESLNPARGAKLRARFAAIRW